MTSFAARIPVRGGIDIGLAMDIGENCPHLYGPAAVSAFDLESKVAQYPRVVVGPNIVKYLRDATNATGADLITQVNRALAAHCASLIGQDQDGAGFIHYLGDGMQKIDNSEDVRDTVRLGLEFVRDQHKLFVDRGDHKLALRYAWLRQYYEKYSPAWVQS
jgi:hypothetical protein